MGREEQLSRVEGDSTQVSKLERSIGLGGTQKGKATKRVLDAPSLERFNVMVQTELAEVSGRGKEILQVPSSRKDEGAGVRAEVQCGKHEDVILLWMRHAEHELVVVPGALLRLLNGPGVGVPAEEKWVGLGRGLSTERRGAAVLPIQGDQLRA